jgi:7-cyano-7-deazaguanine synthase in queuosine biosynthesis
VTANQVISATQNNLTDYLNQAYTNKFSRIAFRVTGIGKPTKGFPFPQDKEREETQRTRSFMFLCLAGLVARRQGYRDVVMIAENGQMAIHLPLSAGRISAFSTHTAHPEFVSLMSDILSRILNYKINIDNPFLYKTKAEVVKLLIPKHQAVIAETVSCWKASRVSHHFHHCGICVPCLIRRIALESNNVLLSEYEKDLFQINISKLNSDDDGKRNLVELCEFVNNFKENYTMAELQLLFPELARTDCFDPVQVVKMYKRFSNEAIAIFQRYPEVMKIIG